jgi:hypothetical protein
VYSYTRAFIHHNRLENKNMPASKYDFSIEQGTSFKLALTYKDSNNSPINITNWCSRLIWTTDDDSTQVFSTTNTDLSIYKFSIDGVTGKLLLQIPASTTNNFTFTKAKYDLELESPNEMYAGGGNEIIRLIFGTIKITHRFSDDNTLLDCQT